MVRWILMAVAAVAVAVVAATPTAAEEPAAASGYYVQPGGCCNMGASLYPCPRPTPYWVGHTYISYAPLNPHEFLYKHHKRYVQSHCEGKTVTRTKYR